MVVVEGTARVEDVDEFVTTLGEIGDRHDAVVQAFDARYVVDRDHLERATEIALRERERDNGIARDAGVEVLLYAAGRRQIERALEMGVSEGATPVAVVVAGDDEDGAATEIESLLDPGDTLGAYDTERVREFFDVSDTELAATEGSLADIVHERVAMLVVER
jgi:KEOPS complex subunit Cgi121